MINFKSNERPKRVLLTTFSAAEALGFGGKFFFPSDFVVAAASSELLWSRKALARSATAPVFFSLKSGNAREAFAAAVSAFVFS